MTESGCTGWRPTCWPTSSTRSTADRESVPRALGVPPTPPERLSTLMNDDCLKLTTYFGERVRTSDGLLSDELMNVYGEHQLQASILLRGAEGFGRLQHLHTDRLLSLSEDLPVVSIALDAPRRIESLLPRVQELQRRGLVTLERARMLSGEIGPVTLPEA